MPSKAPKKPATGAGAGQGGAKLRVPMKRAAQTATTIPRYHVAPVWGQVTATGGSSVTVVLGPHAAKSVNYGSATDANSIPDLMRPLHTRDPGKWVAGHLLNDNLGGSGVARKNLTPLTQNANKRHAKLENLVKNGCEAADQHRRFNRDADFWYGIRYTVDVATVTFGGFAPYSGAPSHITVTAQAVQVDKTTGVIVNVGLLDDMNDYSFGPTQIDNDDADL